MKSKTKRNKEKVQERKHFIYQIEAEYKALGRDMLEETKIFNAVKASANTSEQKELATAVYNKATMRINNGLTKLIKKLRDFE